MSIRWLVATASLTSAVACSAGAVSLGSGNETASDPDGGSFDPLTDPGPGSAVLDASIPPFAGSPQFRSLQIQARPPPPISGGTLIVSAQGTRAFAADPDRDTVSVVDLGNGQVVSTVALARGDEPGRLVEDAAGRVHVALRGGHAVVTLDPTTGAILERREACAAPRGLAYDAKADLVWLACATGELQSFAATGGAMASSAFIERDLRDVVLSGDGFTVSRFRSAEILEVDATFRITRRYTLPVGADSTAQGAWRMIRGPRGSIVVVHEVEVNTDVPTSSPGAYGVTPIVSVQISVCVDAVCVNMALPGAFAVDIAVNADLSSGLLALPGQSFGRGSSAWTFGTPAFSAGDGGFAFEGGGPAVAPFQASPLGVNGQVTAVALAPGARLIVQSREPSTLQILDPKTAMNDAGAAVLLGPVALSPASVDDTGHDIFHAETGVGIACASCHLEGSDDGHVWTLDNQAKRTPSLRGTVRGTAPYHWRGDQADMPALTADVYTNRMGGAPLSSEFTSALQHWVESIPAPPPPAWVDPTSAARGKALFNRADTACATCHSGDSFTNNTTVDVGTGGAFQVPPLVGLGYRAPFLHDGCAATLADRFGAKCSTAGHGAIGALSAGDLADMVMYLEGL